MANMAANFAVKTAGRPSGTKRPILERLDGFGPFVNFWKFQKFEKVDVSVERKNLGCWSIFRKFSYSICYRFTKKKFAMNQIHQVQANHYLLHAQNDYKQNLQLNQLV